jgi:NTE family protein
VAAQVGSGLPVTDLFERQTVPARQSTELSPDLGRVIELIESWERLPLEFPDPAELRREVGQRALAAGTVPEAERRAVIAGRLPRHSWPSRKLAVVAVEAHTGEVRMFDQDSGADLVDAVTASCAIPGIWPPVTIHGGRYIDGGTRSATNADLAAGYQRVLILAPMADPALDEQVAGLTQGAGDGPVQVQVLTPDEESVAAIGINPLEPGVRAPAARAGYAQGQRAAAGVARLWEPGR